MSPSEVKDPIQSMIKIGHYYFSLVTYGEEPVGDFLEDYRGNDRTERVGDRPTYVSLVNS